MNNNYLQILEYFAHISGVLPTLVALVLFKKLESRFVLFTCLLVITLIIDLMGWIMSLNSIQNLLILNIYNVIEFSFLLVFYSLLLRLRLKSFKTIFAITVLILFQIILEFRLNSIETLKTSAWAISNFILVIIILTFLFKLFNKSIDVPYSRLPEFWISIGLLIYFAGTALLFISTELFISENILVTELWSINNLLVIVTNIFITIGLWRIRLSKI